MDELHEAALDSARKIYDSYILHGMSQNPPFEGFGMEVVRFTHEEPKLFLALFVRGEKKKTQ